MLTFGPFQLDADRRELRRDGEPLAVQAKLFDTLVLLAEHRDRVVEKQELFNVVWPDTHVEESTLFQTVPSLRKLLGCGQAGGERYIATIPGRGYQFVASAIWVESSRVAAPVNGTSDSAMLSEQPSVSVRALPVAVGKTELIAPFGPSTPPPSSNSAAAVAAKRWRAVSIGLLTALALVTASAWLSRSDGPSRGPMRKFSIDVDHRVGEVAISPNGRYVAYTQTGDQTGSPTIEGSLWLRDLQTGETTHLVEESLVHHPIWSPDSEFIAFALLRGSEQAVGKISVRGGSVVKIGDRGSGFFGGAWSPNGDSIAYGAYRPAGLYEIAARGGAPRLLFQPSEGGESAGIFYPGWLPVETGGPVMIFSEGTGLQDLNLMLYRPGSARPPMRLGAGFSPTWSPSGHLLFYRDSQGHARLWAMPFSLQSLSPTGDAFPIAEVQSIHGPSVSLDDTLVYLTVDHNGQRQLVWRDRSGRELERIGGPSEEINRLLALSSDGRFVTVSGGRQLREKLWVHDLADNSRTRLTFSEETGARAVWSPDGSEVLLKASRLTDGGGDAGGNLLIKPADGSGESRRVFQVERSDFPCDWSADGRYIIFQSRDRGRKTDLWYAERDAGGGWSEPREWLGTEADESAAVLSPDGRFVAYVSNETGRDEIYVRPFPDGTGLWQVSREGGTQPRWNPNGSEIFYVRGDALMGVPIDTAPTFQVGGARELFRSESLVRRHAEQVYDVAPDGLRFILAEKTEDPKCRIQIVQNWYEEFRGR